MDDMNVLQFLQPAIEAVNQQEAAAQAEQAERERLVQAGQRMAALLLERQIPTERELPSTKPVTTVKPRRVLWDRKITTHQPVIVGEGWDLVIEDKKVQKLIASGDLGDGWYANVTVSDYTTLLTDGSFACYNSHDGTRPIDVMTCEQPDAIKQGLARLAMRYNLA